MWEEGCKWWGRSTYSSRRPNFPSPSSSTRNHLSYHLCFHLGLKERLPNTKARICRVALFVIGYKALGVAMLAFKSLSKVFVVVGGSNGRQKVQTMKVKAVYHAVRSDGVVNIFDCIVSRGRS